MTVFLLGTEVTGRTTAMCSSKTRIQCHSKFKIEMSTRPDPNGTLAFMAQELQAAEDAGQRAWIIGHIPLGKEDTFNDQVRLTPET